MKVERVSIANALLYEYKKSIEHLKNFLSEIPDNKLKIVVNPDDKEFESIQSVLSHTIFWGYYYITMIEADKGLRDKRWSKRNNFNSVHEYINELDKLYKANEDLLKNISDKEMLQPNKDFGDYQSLIEHGIVHIYRHKTQIEKFVKSIDPD